MPDEPGEPLTALDAFLTAYEAQKLATRTEAGDHIIQALRPIAATRREHTKTLLAAVGLSHQNASVTTAVLRGIAGAKSVHRKLIPVWTMPGNRATTGHLTGEFHRVVTAARVSVTCATYNFSPKSNMWSALKQASEEPVSACASPIRCPTRRPIYHAAQCQQGMSPSAGWSRAPGTGGTWSSKLVLVCRRSYV